MTVLTVLTLKHLHYLPNSISTTYNTVLTNEILKLLSKQYLHFLYTVITLRQIILILIIIIIIIIRRRRRRRRGRRPDIVVVEKENNKAIIVDIASPWDHTVYEKEGKKIEKYQDLKREIGRLWGIRHLEVVPVFLGALGVVSNRLDAWLEKLGVTIRTGLLQKTALLDTGKILRKLLES